MISYDFIGFHVLRLKLVSLKVVDVLRREAAHRPEESFIPHLIDSMRPKNSRFTQGNRWKTTERR